MLGNIKDCMIALGEKNELVLGKLLDAVGRWSEELAMTPP